jgi:DNA transposition AAA+ family ATPase
MATKARSNANKLALQVTAERRDVVIADTLQYMDCTGLTTRDLAHRIGRGYSTLKSFLAGNYEQTGGNDGPICAAIAEYMAVHPVGRANKVEGELFQTDNVRLIHQTVEKLLPRPRAFMIYAPPGSQKSFVLQHEIYGLNQRELSKNGHGRRAYYVYARLGIRPRDLVKRIAVACGSSSMGHIDRILANLREHFHGRRVLLIIDEAQHLDLDCLEVIRELLDQPPYFSLLLAGSHDLYTKFDAHSATLEQWNSRIAEKVALPGVTKDEALGIVKHKVGHLLAAAKDQEFARSAPADFVERATVKDVFNGGRQYINIRTLCESLDGLLEESAGGAQ